MRYRREIENIVTILEEFTEYESIVAALYNSLNFSKYNEWGLFVTQKGINIAFLGPLGIYSLIGGFFLLSWQKIILQDYA